MEKTPSHQGETKRRGRPRKVPIVPISPGDTGIGMHRIGGELVDSARGAKIPNSRTSYRTNLEQIAKMYQRSDECLDAMEALIPRSSLGQVAVAFGIMRDKIERAEVRISARGALADATTVEVEQVPGATRVSVSIKHGNPALDVTPPAVSHRPVVHNGPPPDTTPPVIGTTIECQDTIDYDSKC